MMSRYLRRLGTPLCALCWLAICLGTTMAQEPVCPSGKSWTGSAEANGRSTTRVSPDEAKVSVTVSTTQKTSSEARSIGTVSFGYVTDALKAAGLNETRIQTTAYQVEPNYDTDSYYNVRGQPPSNFTYSQTIEITSVPDELGTYIDTAIEVGGNDVRIGSVSFFISPSLAQATLDGLRGVAVANAIESVQVMIEAAGGQMGSPESITDNSYPPYVPYASATPQGSYRDSGAMTGSDVMAAATELYGGLVAVDADVRVKMAICQ